MAGMFEQLINLVGTGNELNSISSALGSDQNSTQRAIAVALPMLLGGLQRNSQSPEGAQALFGALGDHDGSVLGDIAGLLGNGDALADGAKILGHIFGGGNANVASAVSQKSGLDMQTVMRLLPILAPIVMGFLGKMRAQNNLADASAVSTSLSQEREAVREQEPELKGLMRVLDADGDGSVMDEIGGLLGGGGAAGGGGLGSILGKVLGG